MKIKKRGAALVVLDFVKSYWVIIGLLGTVVGTAVAIPSRLTANEKRTEKLEARQEQVDSYIEAIEEQKKLIKKSPAGFRWDEVAEEYVIFKEDPRLKKK